MRLFVRKVRRQVVDCMRQLMKLAKEKSGDGMFPIVEEMLKKTKLICSIPDTVLVEESLVFLEENKINKRPEKDEFSESVSEFMQRNKLKIEIESKSSGGSLQTPCTEFICKVSVECVDVSDGVTECCAGVEDAGHGPGDWVRPGGVAGLLCLHQRLPLCGQAQRHRRV